MAVVDIKTGEEICTNFCTNKCTNKCRNVTRREFGRGLAAIIGTGVAPSIAMGSVARGMMRNVGARNAAMFGGKSLPYDREVEYLQGDGTAFIDTGILADEDFDVSLTVSADPAGIGNFGVFGCYVGSGSKLFYVGIANYSSKRFVGGFDGISYANYGVSSFDINQKYVFRLNKSSSSVNGTAWGSAWGKVNYSGLTLFLFATNGYGYGLRGRVYGFSIAKDGRWIIHLKPVVKSLNGVDTGFLYDEVSNTLFGNASSSGSFSWGELL